MEDLPGAFGGFGGFGGDSNGHPEDFGQWGKSVEWGWDPVCLGGTSVRALFDFPGPWIFELLRGMWGNFRVNFRCFNYDKTEAFYTFARDKSTAICNFRNFPSSCLVNWRDEEIEAMDLDWLKKNHPEAFAAFPEQERNHLGLYFYEKKMGVLEGARGDCFDGEWINGEWKYEVWDH